MNIFEMTDLGIMSDWIQMPFQIIQHPQISQGHQTDPTPERSPSNRQYYLITILPVSALWPYAYNRIPGNLSSN